MSSLNASGAKARARRAATAVVQHVPLAPVTALPHQGGEPGRRALAAQADHLIRSGRPGEALGLLDRVPGEKLSPRAHGLRAQALFALSRPAEALAAARKATDTPHPDLSGFLTHLEVAHGLADSDEADAVMSKAPSVRPRNAREALRLVSAFSSEDSQVIASFIASVQQWSYPVGASTLVRLDTERRLAAGETPQQIVALAAQEAADPQHGLDVAVVRLSKIQDWTALAEVLGGRPVGVDLAKEVSRYAQRALRAGWLDEAATIAESAIRSGTRMTSARSTHAQALDQIAIVRAGWPVVAAAPRAYEPDPRSTLSVLAQSLPHRSGGYATRSHGILKGLQDLGWRAQAVTRLGFPYDRWPASAAEVPDQDVVDGITYHRLLEPGERTYSTTPMSSYIERFSHRIMEQATAQKAALVHASSFQNNGLAGLAAARRLGLPFVYEMRGLEDLMKVSRRPDFEGSHAYRYMTGLENHIVAQADLTFVITEALREEMIRRGGPADRIEVLPNGVHTADFEPRPRDEALVAELGLSGRTIVGYAGGLVDYEGLDLLLRAAAELKQDRSDFAVVIVGDGHMENRLHHLAAELGVTDVVTFTGRVPHAEIPRYLSVFDITPFPRLPLPVCELISPIKPFEAMAMEKAVITSSVAALTEIVEPDVRGLVFDKGEASDLAAKIALYLDDPALREKLGRQGREWVLAERDWSDVVTVVDAAYHRLVGAS
jgi:glycosyltransferase involved in cell wall biosynthesis